jgi:hypothetical protein
LTYINKQVWQKNVANMYWGKTDPYASWSPANGQSSLPAQLQVSKDGTTITKESDAPLIDANFNSWSLVSSQNGLQVAVNGTTDTTTSQVTALGFFGGKIWQENVNKMWWNKATPADSWGPDGGTSTAPTVANTTTKAIDTSAIQSSIKQEVSDLQAAMPTAKDQSAVKAAISALNAALTALQAVT